MTALRIGIDLGGTKIEGVLVAADGSEVLRHRIPTPRDDYSGTITAIANVVAHLEAIAGQTGLRVGIGIPGSISPISGLLRNGNSTWLNGRPFKPDMQSALNRNLRISNDANCLALSEFRDGAGQGVGVLFAVILGTGVGGGLVVNGQLVDGAHGIGAEFGHVPLAFELAPPLCYCGRTGCNETYLAGPSIVQDYLGSGGVGVNDLQDISARAQAGEALAITVLARHLRRLGQAVATVVNLIDPHMIVLGGGVSNLPGLIGDLPDAIAPHIFAPKGDRIIVDVRQARWGDSSGVRGAAQLWEVGE